MSEYEAGTIVDGRYRVISRIGTGGMADVYLAEDVQLSREVAIKVLHRRFAEDPGFVERFRREAQSAAGLQHPNVVSVFDRGAYDDTYYIAMEYLEGRTLKQLIREEAPLDPVRAIDITIQILKAARFAHRRGVIHRDLKPHNVIVDSTRHAKVTDFGIARAGASDMTETGSIMGTSQYLSPEQAQGYPVSEPSDLYSVAIVLYEMLTGRVPFDGDSPVTIALKHVSEAPTPPSQLHPDVPQVLEQVVLWALNKNPSDRPANADEFISALEQARAVIGTGVSEATASMRIASPGYVGSGPAAAGAYPATSLMPAAGPAQAAAAYGSSENLARAAAGNGTSSGGGNDDHKHENSGGGIWPWLAGLLVILLIAGGVLAFLLTRPTKVTVPDVVGLSVQVAQAKVEADGLNPNVIYLVSSKPQGQVIYQGPDAYARVNSGATVSLTVSNGPGTVNVPTVASMTQKQAIAAIKHAGLSVGTVIPQSSSTIAKGDAVDTSPDAGTSLTRNTAVELYISSGLQVPDVTGDTVPQAQQALSAFTVKIVRQPTAGVAPGTVFQQDPKANASASSDSTVTIYVAQKVASTTAKVPDVVGYTAAGATNTLTSAGFKVTDKYQVVSAANEVGNVVSQSPAGNRSATKASTVTITIGKVAATTTTTTSTTSTTTTTTQNPSSSGQ